MKMCFSEVIATIRQALRRRETHAVIMLTRRGSTKDGVGRPVRWPQAETIQPDMESSKGTDRQGKAPVPSAIPIIARGPHFNHWLEEGNEVINIYCNQLNLSAQNDLYIYSLNN